MLDRLPRGKRNLGLAIVGVLALWLSWRVREVLNPLLLGYLLAFIVHPAVLRLQRRGWSRRRAVNLIFIAGGVAGAMITLALVVQGANLMRRLARTPILDQLGQTGEEIAEALQTWLPSEDQEGEASGTEETPLPGQDQSAASDPGTEDPATVADAADVTLLEVMRDLWAQLSEEQAADASTLVLRRAGGIWSTLRHWFGSLIGLGLLLVLLPVYTYFLLFELGRIHGFVARYIPIRERDRVTRIGRQIGEVIANFFRGRLIVCFLKGVILTIGLTLVGVDYALLLGMGSGFLSLIPFVGPLGGFVLALILAMTAPGAGLVAMAGRIAVVFVVAEVVEGYYLVPKILGETLGLHAVVVLVSVFAGGALLGMFGFLIALPLTAGVVILVRELVLPALADFADEDGPSRLPGT
ncbi:MAG: putative PurR-regulated permease PerM [Chlamydiales bacterium]|jgi:predicted PurR-regulated permease PerM